MSVPERRVPDASDNASFVAPTNHKEKSRDRAFQLATQDTQINLALLLCARGQPDRRGECVPYHVRPDKTIDKRIAAVAWYQPNGIWSAEQIEIMCAFSSF